jgi:type IV pilus assembly protein PilM
MARAVGLDIGTRTIKVVEISGSPKAFKIQRLAIRDVPRAPEEAPAEGEEPFDPVAATAAVVRDIFESLKLPKEDVCASFDSGTTVSREIVVPFLEPEKIRKVVKFEAEHHLHSQSVDEVVVNWIKTGETKEGSRLTIFASSKEELVQKLAVMRMAGIEPASIDLDCTAVFTCADAMGLFVANPNAILLDVGAHVTSLMLVIEGKPRMVRSFLLGVGNLPPALPTGGAPGGVGDLFVSASSLQAAPQKAAGAATAELAPRDAHLDFVRKLHREVIRSLASVRSDAPPTVVYLGGGGALLPEVPEALQEKFGLPVQRLNVFEKAECRDQGPDPAYAGAVIPNAVGCALRLLGHNPLDIELLQDEFAPSNTFEVVRTAAATVVTLLFLVLLGLTYIESRERTATLAVNESLWQQFQQMFHMAEAKYLEKVEHKDKATADKLASDWLRAQPRNEKRIGNLRSRLISRHGRLKDMLGKAKNIPEIESALRVYFELVKALAETPRDQWGEWFQIEQFNCNERRLTFTIVTSQVRDIDEVSRLVGKSEYFKGRAKDVRVIETTGGSAKTPKGYESQAFEVKFEDQD